MAYKNKQDMVDYSRKYYLRNIDKRNKQITKRKKEIRKWYKDYKRSLKCSRCPEDDDRCLDFHHYENKKETISRMVYDGTSIKNIKKEMEKCEVLCANCHRKETYTLY